MQLRIKSLSLRYAKEICDWKYDDIYSVYNYPTWEVVAKEKWAIAIEEKRKEQFLSAVNENEELCGYVRFVDNDDYVLVGLGLKPDLCGNNLGDKLMELIKEESKARYDKDIVLEVRSFNERAIKSYMKAGFEIIDTYEKDSLMGKSKFVKMIMKVN